MSEFYIPDGGSTTTDGESDVSVEMFFDLEIQWQSLATFSVNKQFEWNVGELPLKWYQVEGCCTYLNSAGDGTDPGDYSTDFSDDFLNYNKSQPGGCDVVGIETDDPKCASSTGKQQFIQTILARSLSDLCDQLTASRMRWQICTIKQWSRPYDPALVSPDDQCNVLTTIPHSQIPACMPFALQTQTLVRMGIKTYTIDVIYTYTGSGGAETGGSAQPDSAFSDGFGVGFGGFMADTSDFVYEPTGDICLTGGSAEATSSWDVELLTVMGIQTFVENFEPVFGTDVPDGVIAVPSNTISTRCGECTQMPLVLYFHHNFGNDNVFMNFMQRNGFDLPNPFTMHYSTRLESWVANLHFSGSGEDNGENEDWRFSVEWACTQDIGGDDLGFSSWKFSVLVVRKTEEENFDTRIFVVLPPETICEGISNLEFDFSFSLNTTTNFVSNDYDIIANQVLLTDGIGLFKSKFWKQNPNFNIRLSKSSVLNGVQRQDISPIFPQSVTLGASSTNTFVV